MTDKLETILIVDDEPSNIITLNFALKSQYMLLNALGADEAFDHLEHSTVDLILLDIMMPGMDGYEVCRRIKANPDTSGIPIIFTTAKDAADDETKGLSLGAVDYLTKPIHRAILLSRIKTHLELRDALVTVMQQNEQLHRERETIENIVLTMRKAENMYTEGVRKLLSPLDKTNGDILLSALTVEQEHCLMLGDFTGHGLTAAVGGPMVSHIFYDMFQNGAKPFEVIQSINEALWKRLPTGLFMACAFLVYHKETSDLKVYNYGIPELLYYSNATLSERFCSRSTMLGVIETVPVDDIEQQVTVTKGDCIYAYSDGVTETLSESGEPYGKKHLETILESIQKIDRPLDDILDELRLFAGKQGFSDDISVIELRF